MTSPARQHVHPGQGRLMPVPVEEHSQLKAAYPPVVADSRLLIVLREAAARGEGPIRSSRAGARAILPGWYAAERLAVLRDVHHQVTGDDHDGWTAVGGIEIEAKGGNR